MWWPKTGTSGKSRKLFSSVKAFINYATIINYATRVKKRDARFIIYVKKMFITKIL